MKRKLPCNLQFFAGAAEDTAAGEDTATTAVESAETGTGTEKQDEAEPDTADQKKDTTEDIDKRIADAVAEELKKAAMSDDEKKQYEDGKREQTIADREAAVDLRERRADAKVLLTAQELPDEFLEMVLGSDKKETEEKVKVFKQHYDAAVQTQVEKRLKGTTPSTGTGSTGMSGTEALAAEVASYL